MLHNLFYFFIQLLAVQGGEIVGVNGEHVELEPWTVDVTNTQLQCIDSFVVSFLRILVNLLPENV